jgi:hypothetical protein
MQDVRALVSIMDLVMFEAQRQGRLSFYMVCYRFLSLSFLVFPRRWLQRLTLLYR